MTSCTFFRCFVAAVCVAAGCSSLLADRILVLCRNPEGLCEYRRIAALQVNGRRSVRLIAPSDASASEDVDSRHAREVKLDAVGTMYRDSKTGLVSCLDETGRPGDVVIPRVSKHDTGTPAALWRSAELEYRTTLKDKNGIPVPVGSWVALLAQGEDDAPFIAWMRHVVDTPELPARTALIQGGLKFAGNAPGMQQWRNSLLREMQENMTQYDAEQGDPATLLLRLRGAGKARETFLTIANPADNRELTDKVAAANELVTRRIMIAGALRKGGYPDEYLSKTAQLGLARWALPDYGANARDALIQSSTGHEEQSRKFVEAKQLDRAFDEALLASEHNPCNADLAGQFYRIRVHLVDPHHGSAPAEYSGPRKAELEQILRELDQLDVNKERWTMNRIHDAELM